MKKFLIIVSFIFLIFIFGCDRFYEKNDKETLKSKPTFVVLADGDSQLTLLDKKMNVVKKINNQNKFQNFALGEDNDLIYALEDGTYMGTAPSMHIINIFNGNIEKKIELPNIPSTFLVFENKAYIASSEIFSEGMPFFTINLSNGKIEETIFTKGMVSTIKQYNGEIYLTINSGGTDLFGEFSNIFRLQNKNNKFEINPLIEDKIELPPSDFVVENNKLFCVFTGFSYGPKPEWVQDPERYTNKFMIVDMNNGRIINEKNLAKPFPQKMISVGNYFYINNYTDLDMQGEFITVLNKTDLQESFISIKNPAYFDYNSKLEGFLVSNPENGTLQFLKNRKIVKKIKVGKNSSIVKSVF